MRERRDELDREWACRQLAEHGGEARFWLRYVNLIRRCDELPPLEWPL